MEGCRRTTTKVIRALNLNVVEGNLYDGLINMLDANRFDYSRGIDEVFGEYDVGSKTHKNIMIEPHLLLRMPMPVYLYVSPARTCRIEKSSTSAIRF